MVIYSQLCNCSDLFSFYKEALAGDDGNFVSRYARIQGKTPYEALDVIVDRLILRDETVRTILGAGKARDAWDSFTAGFTQFHILAPRYRMHEVIPEFY